MESSHYPVDILARNGNQRPWRHWLLKPSAAIQQHVAIANASYSLEVGKKLIYQPVAALVFSEGGELFYELIPRSH